MLKVFIVCSLFIFISCSKQAQSPEEKIIRFSIEGILYDESDPRVVIDGETWGVGERIFGAKILDITENQIKFEYNNKVFSQNFYVTREDVGRSKKAAKKKLESRKKNSK